MPRSHRFTDGKEIRWWKSREQVLVLTHFEMKIRRRNSEEAVAVTPENPGQSDLPTEDNYESSLPKGTDDMTDDYPMQEDNETDSDYKFFDFSGHEGRSDTLPLGLERTN